MNKEDIKVGMWLRYVNEGHYSPRAFRVDSFKRRYDGEVGPHGFTPDGVEMNPRHQDCEPWVPRVGEWVRCTRTGRSGKVIGTWQSHGMWWSFEGGYYGRAGECEPCLPPTEQPAGLTMLLTGGVEVPYVQQAAPPLVECYGAALTPEQREELWKRVYESPKDCDCPRCTGPALRMLSFECQGKDWRKKLPKEPEVTEGRRDLGGTWHPSTVLHYRGDEMAWRASGHGAVVVHPIRETAIALWREAVERG